MPPRLATLHADVLHCRVHTGLPAYRQLRPRVLVAKIGSLSCNNGCAGYLKFNDAQNTVRLTLQEPTAGCNPNDTGCKACVHVLTVAGRPSAAFYSLDRCQDSFAPLSHLPYCCAQNSSCKTNDDGSCSLLVQTGVCTRLFEEVKERLPRVLHICKTGRILEQGEAIVRLSLTCKYKTYDQLLSPRQHNTDHPYHHSQAENCNS